MKNFLSLLIGNIKRERNALILPLVFIAIAAFAKIYVLSDNRYPVTYQSEVKRDGYEASPATYRVAVSPALAWDMTHVTFGSRVQAAFGSICFWLALVLLCLFTFDKLQMNKQWKKIASVGLLLVLWLFLKYGAHSSAVANTYVDVTPEQYHEAVNAPGDGIKLLFKDKAPL